MKRLPSLRRLVGHPPTFDWVEARRRHRRGESMNSIARDMGVDRRSVNRVVKMSERHVHKAMSTLDEDVRASLLGRDKTPCPRCGRPKMAKAKLCRDCADETREFLPTTLVRVPGIRRTELWNVEGNRIVRVGDRWGVVYPTTRERDRIVDFWEGGREYVPARTVVEVARGTRVLVGGLDEEGEDI